MLMNCVPLASDCLSSQGSEFSFIHDWNGDYSLGRVTNMETPTTFA